MCFCLAAAHDALSDAISIFVVTDDDVTRNAKEVIIPIVVDNASVIAVYNQKAVIGDI
jgi:hypothetical protein